MYVCNYVQASDIIIFSGAKKIILVDTKIYTI